MYKIIGNRRSRTTRVYWLLEELGVAYERISARPHAQEVTRINPSGKIPVLLHGEAAITDSTAIMTWLADRHGGLAFPCGSLERARQDSHTQFLLDEFDACLWMAARHTAYLPEEHRVPAVVDSLKWEFSRSQERFAERLGEGPFLMGEKMTIPDIIAAHCGRWAMSAGFPVGHVLKEYTERLTAREAFARALRP